MTPATCADMPTAADAAKTDAPAPTRLVVIGNGMVGHRLCAQLTDHLVAPANTHVASSPASTPPLSITVLGQEPHSAYNRVHLGELFDNQDALAKLTLGDHAWYAARGIELRTSTQVQHIDTQAKCLRTHDGQTIPCDQLVLATGSRPFVPPIDGANLPGVFVYRTVQDVAAMRQAASQILNRRLQQLGIDIRLQAQTRSITPGPRSPRKGPTWQRGCGTTAIRFRGWGFRGRGLNVAV